MKTPLQNPPKPSSRAAVLRTACCSAAAILVVLLNWSSSAQVAIDKLHGYGLMGSASYSTNAGGHTSQSGDYAMDLGNTGGASLAVTDAGFLAALNLAMAGDTLSVSMWIRENEIAATSAFWFYSPSDTATGQRGFQAHVPWSDGNIYFDTAGCCAAAQRISANINTFPPWIAVGDHTWWNSWRHFVFLKNGSTKQIWIDGILFLQGQGTAPLPTDIYRVAVGSGIPGNPSIHGLVDDFAVFGAGLSSNDIHLLFTGTAPEALIGANPLAYWDFNLPAKPMFAPLQAGPGATSVSPDLSAYFTIANGSTAVQVNTIRLAVNSVDVTGTATIIPRAIPPVLPGGAGATVYYASPTPFPQASTQTVTLVYSDNATPASVYSNTWPVIIQAYNGYVTDATSGRLGFLEGSAAFTPDRGGHSGAAGDRAIDLNGVGAGGVVHVGSGQILNQGATNNTLSFSMWMKMHRISNGGAVFARSPSSSGGELGFGVRPWSDNNIYFDTAGCCDADRNRIVSSITGFPGYVDDSFWTQWHQYVFVFNAGNKEIWIDGQPFMSGYNSAALPADFRDILFGFDPSNNAYQQAVIDDVAVYATALSAASISSLMNGTLPTALSGETVLGYWNCDTLSPGPPFISTASTPAPNSTNALPNVGANIIIVNRNTQVQTNSIRVALNDVDVTSTANLIATDAGVTINYLSPNLLPALSLNTVTVVFSDNALPPNLSSNRWSFRIAPYGPHSRDAVYGYLAMFLGPTQFTPDGGGHAGALGTRAIDLGTAGNGGANVTDPPFLTFANAAAGKDTLSVSFWLKQRNISQSSAFWFESPSVDRNFQAHVPWTDDTIYFDTGGCCNGTAHRISQGIQGFDPWIAVGSDAYWTNWHHFVFLKNGSEKQIYIDGQLFFAGTSTATLTTDMSALAMGTQHGAAQSPRGWLDDFAVFGGTLLADSITELAAGASPLTLGHTNLLAFWNFEDPGLPFIGSRVPAPNATEVPASGPASHVIVTLVDGSTKVNSSTPRMTFNGLDVSSQLLVSTPAAGVLRLEYAPPMLPSNSTNRVELVFNDNASTPNLISNAWSFVTETYTGTTKDTLHQYPGLIQTSARFSANGEGKSGQPGDYAMDMTASGGAVHINDATFLYPAETNNTMTFAFWAKHYDNANNSAFWVNSPSSSGGERGFQAHLPNGNNIYFDTAGCCDATLHRISASISTFPGYTDIGFWTNWHHYVFVFNAGDKTVWIDGQLFLQGNSSSPLPLDFTHMYIGRDYANNEFIHAKMDNFAAFASPVTPENILLLYQGASPTNLAGEKILAFWEFNDAPARPTISIGVVNGTLSITYTGKLQSSDTVNGTYTDVAGATSPYPVPTSPARLFFRSAQ